jgi:hypothetical protein
MMRIARLAALITALAASASAAPVQLDATATDCAPVAAAAQGATVAASWGRTAAGDTTLITRRGSSPWQAPAVVSATDESWYYSMCAGPSAFYMVLSRPTVTGWHLFLSKSTDAGATWSPPATLPLGTGNEILPKVVHTNGTLCLVWVNQNGTSYECVFSRSTDDGVNWSVPLRLSAFGAYVESVGITAAAPGTVCATWTELTGGANEVFFRKSTNSGSSWNTALRVTALDGIDDSNPGIAAASGGRLVLAFQEFTGTAWEVMVQTSADGGATWGSATILSAFDQKDSHLPAAVANGADEVAVAWTDEGTSPSRVGWRESLDGAVSWQSASLTSAQLGPVRFPQIAPGSPGGWELFWAEQSGVNWYPYYTRVGAGASAGISLFEIY